MGICTTSGSTFTSRSNRFSSEVYCCRCSLTGGASENTWGTFAVKSSEVQTSFCMLAFVLYLLTVVARDMSIQHAYVVPYVRVVLSFSPKSVFWVMYTAVELRKRGSLENIWRTSTRSRRHCTEPILHLSARTCCPECVGGNIRVYQVEINRRRVYMYQVCMYIRSYVMGWKFFAFFA